jgi:HPt (histidine-containing phosphotransfer) domain-containing protein
MTFNEAITEIGVNTEETLRRFSGNAGLMEKFIRKFPQDNTLQSLEAAIAAKDYQAIEETAHTLKGVSGNLGFTKLYELSAALVTAVRAKDYAKADELSPQVTEKCHEVLDTLAKIDS